MKYEVVDADGLIKRLGRQCSPKSDYGHYVIGPVANGTRIAHIASCRTKREAENYAEYLNKEYIST